MGRRKQDLVEVVVMITLKKRFAVLAKSMTCDEIERVFESTGHGERELGDLEEEDVLKLFMWILDQDTIEGEKVTDEFKLKIYKTLNEGLREFIKEAKKEVAIQVKKLCEGCNWDDECDHTTEECEKRQEEWEEENKI